MTPVSGDQNDSAQEIIRRLLSAGWYAFGERTYGRKALAPGDMVCFYESGQGVVAEAEVDSYPEKEPAPGVRDVERHPYRFRVKNVRMFFDNPIKLDLELRKRLDGFRGKDPGGNWSWFVQGTGRVTERDYNLLTGRATE